MKHLDDENFMKMLEEEFPDVDWDNLPLIDSKPTHWTIRGMQWHRLEFVVKKEEIKSKCGFECGHFPTKSEAQAFLDAISTNPLFCEEQLIHDQTVPGHVLENNPLKSKEYLGPVIFDTLHLVELGDDELLTLHMYKVIRDRILKKGKQCK